MISFNKPSRTGREEKYIHQALKNSSLAGNGFFSQQCQSWFEDKLNTKRCLLTPSCTAALEMAAILIDVQPGDEIIMPSYTFVSTANAFVLRGAKVVFVDIHPQTMNINEELIEKAITRKTKAIVPVHYAGVACEMDTIMSIARKYNIYVIEDAAQGMMSNYKKRPLGTIGHLGAYSFHETKNYTSGGEGGLLIVNDDRLVERSEIIREKGTNRSQFFRGQINKYTWMDVGSSFLPSELQAAYLWGQIEGVSEIYENRMEIWNSYFLGFLPLQESECLEIPKLLKKEEHNAHIFYLKLRDIKERTSFIEYMRGRGVLTVFHYVPLHSSEGGRKYGYFHGEDCFTTKESERLVRLPLYYGMTPNEKDAVIDGVKSFFKPQG